MAIKKIDIKGFTLIELMAVIIILSIIILVAVAPNITGAASKTRQKSYDLKVKMMEDAAILYGQDKYALIVQGATSGTKTKVVTVKDLLDERYLSDEEEKEIGKIGDPRTPGADLNDCQITISIAASTRKVTAVYNLPVKSGC